MRGLKIYPMVPVFIRSDIGRMISAAGVLLAFNDIIRSKTKGSNGI